ncbi:MAG: type V CRISPR-associated protein Cas12k [Phormidesmis sp. CAN_BIN36]|nr:type V CRISPR-associated protein Cas12k [Phormidesmis sp. CAN_BIN36]
MSIITVHCRAIAAEPIRRHLWQLMTQSNTPLINDLLKQVSLHNDFEIWKRRGSIPKSTVADLCIPLKEAYPGQPPRFYSSAILTVTSAYESWLKLQHSNQLRLNGKQQWLNVVKSDDKLLEISGTTLDAIQQQARDILIQIDKERQSQSAANPKQSKKANATKDTDLMSRLFKAYEATDNLLSRCAIAHLLKNDCKIAQIKEDPTKFAHRIQRKQKEIERLAIQISARLPKGRDLTGEKFLQTLEIATKQVPKNDAQMREWHAKLLTRTKLLPYPIVYGSSTDVFWGKTAKGRIIVNFNGLTKYFQAIDPGIKEWLKVKHGYPFQLYCDRRQLPFFQRFVEDWQIYQANKDTYPAGLLTLSSATLAWREGEGKGEPWNVNHLALHCTFDTRLMTAEGTLAVQHEKSDRALKKLTNTNPDLRNNSTLERLKKLPTRPSQKPYQGNPEILVGLSIGLADPVTAIVVNGRTGDVLAYGTPRMLLGERYHSIERYRHQQQQTALNRQENQHHNDARSSESELGQSIDRLLAQAIGQLARQYQAHSIVIPNLTHLREFLASEIAARAEQKCPGSVAAQDRYAKKYRIAIHRWSYRRLIEAIHSKAKQLEINVESGFQPLSGKPQSLAKDVAISAYSARTSSTK